MHQDLLTHRHVSSRGRAQLHALRWLPVGEAWPGRITAPAFCPSRAVGPGPRTLRPSAGRPPAQRCPRPTPPRPPLRRVAPPSSDPTLAAVDALPARTPQPPNPPRRLPPQRMWSGVFTHPPIDKLNCTKMSNVVHSKRVILCTEGGKGKGGE